MSMTQHVTFIGEIVHFDLSHNGNRFCDRAVRECTHSGAAIDTDRMLISEFKKTVLAV